MVTTCCPAFAYRCLRCSLNLVWLLLASRAINEAKTFQLRRKCPVPNLTLPDNNDPPTKGNKSCFIALVSFNVLVKLRLPTFDIGFRGVGKSTSRVPVPVAAVYLNDRPQSRKYDVGPTWKVATMQPKTIAANVEPASYGLLRLGV